MNCDSILVFQERGSESKIIFSCQLKQGHIGPHQQTGIVASGERRINYTIQWQDPRERSKLFIPEIKVDQRVLVSV